MPAASPAPVARLGQSLTRWSERFLPDPFVLAIFLTAVAMLTGFVWFTPAAGISGPVGLADRLTGVLGGWSDAFFRGSLLEFAFQMCLVLVTGHALATSGPVQRIVARIARLPRNTAQAAVLVAIVAMVAGVLHWGLGAVVGAFLARDIGRIARREGRPLHYPLLGAAAYMGLLVWHGGLSGSAPLKIAEPGHFLADAIGVVDTRLTLFSGFNLAITGAILVLVPVLFRLLTPRASRTRRPARPLAQRAPAWRCAWRTAASSPLPSACSAWAGSPPAWFEPWTRAGAST
jgi:short-chain fatty acids transporter